MTTITQRLKDLANEKSAPCVTISLNTHRTHPDNAQDAIQLKKLLKEASDRVIKEYGKRPVAALLEKLSSIESEIDSNYNLDSLHLYLSNDTEEIIRLPWAVNHDELQISDSFDVLPLIKLCTKTASYLILLLSQSGASLYSAINDGVSHEIHNGEFPFLEASHYNTNPERGGDTKHSEKSGLEFMNKIDKAVVKAHNETGLNCIVICTEDNYGHLMQVADKKAIYIGHTHINHHNTSLPYIAKQSWDLMRVLQTQQRAAAINEVKEAVGLGMILTDLQEVYLASMDGLGDLLIVDEAYEPAVIMISERLFELTKNIDRPRVVEDLSSHIAWEVISHKGRVFFAPFEEIKDLGHIVLKTRYVI